MTSMMAMRRWLSAVVRMRWSPEAESYRPGEFTALSWVTHAGPAAALFDRAAAFQATIDADRTADGVSGLAELRRILGG